MGRYFTTLPDGVNRTNSSEIIPFSYQKTGRGKHRAEKLAAFIALKKSLKNDFNV
jgi:hypothetical protein